MMAAPIAAQSAGFSGSYDPADVTFLLKPIAMPLTDVAAKEALIQSGARHYSEMLSAEAAPSAEYMAIYRDALAANALKLAQHINTLADAMAARGGSPVIVSLARAGTPVGVLLGRALRRRGHPAPHYSVSIIRGRGIDGNALRHILGSHAARDLVFVDGWTGKGAIAAELRGPHGAPAHGIEPLLAVVADPAGCADLAATAEDYVIPSGILNGIVSGLVSRSVLNASIGPRDFHGCVVLDHLRRHDISRDFVGHVDALARIAPPQDGAFWQPGDRDTLRAGCETMLAAVAADTGVTDRNRIKPGIAEATRAVLRRVPHRLLLSDAADPNLRHLVHLAKERGVATAPLPAGSVYRAVAVIASVGDE